MGVDKKCSVLICMYFMHGPRCTHIHGHCTHIHGHPCPNVVGGWLLCLVPLSTAAEAGSRKPWVKPFSWGRWFCFPPSTQKKPLPCVPSKSLKPIALDFNPFFLQTRQSWSSDVSPNPQRLQGEYENWFRYSSVSYQCIYFY